MVNEIIYQFVKDQRRSKNCGSGRSWTDA